MPSQLLIIDFTIRNFVAVLWCSTYWPEAYNLSATSGSVERTMSRIIMLEKWNTLFIIKWKLLEQPGPFCNKRLQ